MCATSVLLDDIKSERIRLEKKYCPPTGSTHPERYIMSRPTEMTRLTAEVPGMLGERPGRRTRMESGAGILCCLSAVVSGAAGSRRGTG